MHYIICQSRSDLQYWKYHSFTKIIKQPIQHFGIRAGEELGARAPDERSQSATQDRRRSACISLDNIASLAANDCDQTL